MKIVLKYREIKLFIVLLLSFICSGMVAQNNTKPPVDCTLSSNLWQIISNRDSKLEKKASIEQKYSTKEDSLEFEMKVINHRTNYEIKSKFGQIGASVNHVIDNAYNGYIHIDSLLSIDYKTVKDFYIFPGYDDSDEGDFEGPTVTNSSSYETGITDPNAGLGIKIAVIDGGFDGYAALAQMSPPNGSFDVVAYECLGGPCTVVALDPAADDDHGAKSAEQVYDHAPAATYRLYDVNSFNNSNAVTAINHAKSWADIITMSQSKYNFGWNDDDGIVCSAVNNTLPNEEWLFFDSAGNRQNTHYQSDFIDNNSDNFHDYNGTRQTFTLTPSQAGKTFLQWDGDPLTSDHYDILFTDTNLSDGDCLAGRVTGGVNTMGYETIEIDSDTTSHNCIVSITIRSNVEETPDFEYWSHNVGGSFSQPSTGNQTSSPGNCTSDRLITVAAVDQLVYDMPEESDVIESYSSIGPTNDGAITMDLAGPTDCTTHANNTTGTFGGTSCATPNLAGAAGAVWSRYPTMSHLDVKHFMYRMADMYRDWGAVGRDSIYGYGGLFLYDFNLNNLFLDQEYGDPITSPYNTYFPWYNLEQIDYTTFPDRTIILLSDDTSVSLPILVDKKFLIRGAVNASPSYIIE